MALIKVGIHENLVLSDESKINDKGTLELCVKSVQDPNALLNAFENNTTFNEMKSSFRFYPPNMTDFEGRTKTAPEIAQELLRMRHQLMQYALLYATKAEVETAIGGLAMFEGLGIPKEDMAKAINQFTDENFTKKVVTNLCTKFLEFLRSKNAFNGQVTFRQKFLRQSKAKNYATIPLSDFDVWIEPMSVPKDASKVAFTDYEIKNGKHLDHPVASTDAETSAEDANKAQQLFSAPAENGEEKTPQNNVPDTSDAVASQPNLFDN